LQFRNGKHDHRIGSACFKRALQFKGLLQHMQDDWNNLLTSEETQILTHYAEKSRTLMLAYSSMKSISHWQISDLFELSINNRRFDIFDKLSINNRRFDIFDK